MPKKQDVTTAVLPQILPEIFVVQEGDIDEQYRNTYDTREDAVDANNKDGTHVATYRLVKVELMALKRSTRIMSSPVVVNP